MTLQYFGLGGRAENIRMLLHHAGAQFEDKRLTFPEFGAIKDTTPLGGMPLWIEDGFTMCQGTAILRMLGIRHGYYSEDPMTCWAIDSMVDFIEGEFGNCGKWLGPATQGQPLDPAGEDGWFTGYWDKIMPVVEKRLAGHGKKYIGGTDRPSIADFKLFGTLSMVSSLNPATCVPASATARLDQKIESMPQFKRWVQAMKTENANFLANRTQAPL